MNDRDPGPSSSQDLREHIMRKRGRSLLSHQQRFNPHRSQPSLHQRSQDRKKNHREVWSYKTNHNEFSYAPPRKIFKDSTKCKNIPENRKLEDAHRGPEMHKQTNKNHERYLGFKLLEEIAHSDSEDILVKINQWKEAFFNLIKSHIEKPDVFVLITELMSKIALSSFNELKMQIIQEICNSAYLGNFQKYLMDIPYMQVSEISSNNLYWKNQEVFWEKFITFNECLVSFLPLTALQKCRSLIEDSSKLCLEKLAERHDFKLSDECSSRLIQLRERLILCENEMRDISCKKKVQSRNFDSEPPQGFRELNVIPDSEELLGKQPFLRPNVVEGGYNDKEHYLDVQYRLLREDCFGPLREGIRQYMAQPGKGKYDHIRVYKNVRFLGPYIPKSQSNIGSLIQVDVTSKKWPKRINWAHSKRFLYGSLLLFTRDKCNTFIVATLLERDEQMLSTGQFAVCLVNAATDDIYDDKPYVMIETEVYFEPYFQVLNALKAPDFPEHVAMEKYIVNVDPQTTPPGYLSAEKNFKITTKTSKFTFNVLDDGTWPNKEDMGFDTSQYEAYKLALTHEFAVIQGPPGTGKSFLGVKVAGTLLKNLKFEFNGCLMLVICYTNHALDQFLEALLPITESIVRIGGRSRNEAMDKINLNNLRRNVDKNPQKFMMREKKRDLRQAVLELESALNCLDIINKGVLSYKSVERFIPNEIGFLGKLYPEKQIGDPLKYWLFEHCMIYVDYQQIQWDRFQTNNIQMVNNVEEDTNRTNEPIFDDFEDDDHQASFDHQTINASFSINTAEGQIENLKRTYNITQSPREKRALEHAVRVLTCEIKCMKEMSIQRKENITLHITRWTNFNVMTMVDRWRLYFRWAKIIANKVNLEIPKLQEAMRKAIVAYEESRMIVDLELLKETRVVGMTTSGAARLRKLLQSLGPPIVIVEEAAEVLEAHIVTSLTKHCQHLILIGDHQQLRPSISNLKLVRRYNTNVSLFERMITNGIHSRRLGVQHRMRPEIAALISPHIYPDLDNHISVQDFPNVLGMTSNLFFFTHDFQEQEVEDSSSRTNHQEGDLTIALANYLIQQGYHPEDVTILTTYKGQMFYLKKQKEKYLLLSHVKITVVDNYQGEESKIILLSLVRNNPDNSIGFLKIENRICVALSRAKEGLYIFGNIHTLKSNSDLWKNIGETLQNNGNLGNSLTLRCENHPEKTASISVVEDFMKLPEGGCGVDCNFMRTCGHKCPRLCHFYDREHTKNKCLESCERVLCDFGHRCPLKCGQDCEPCKQLVEKQLPCGHNQQVKCHIEPTDTSIKCLVELDVTLPACGHKARKDCYQPLEAVLCSSKCMIRVEPCGHRCGRKCHVNDDPDHEKYVCRKPCARAKYHCRANLVADRGDHQCKKQCSDWCDPCDVKVEKKRSSCGHVLRVQCHEDVDQIPCQINCDKILVCKHKCPKKCGEECGNCIQKINKVIPDCKHKIKIACSKEATSELCTGKCQRVMACGHACRGRCNQTCAPEKCLLVVKEKYMAPCGHQVNLPCNLYNAMIKGGVKKPELLLIYCTEPCLQELACGHLCGGSCGACHQGRLHVPCTQTCNQINICGHQCVEPCNQICPPCNKPCEIKCSCGLRCNKLCGAPCALCSEPCTRKCRHGACSRLCGEPCSRPPCDEACDLRLPCGHHCRGLCGEPCPDICNICRPEDFPTDFLEGEYDKNQKFITLYDCSHVFELDDIDTWVKNEPELVKIPDCPKCRKPIVNTYRYKDIINGKFKNEINPIKERVYGNAKKIKNQKNRLSSQITRCRAVHQTIMRENLAWRKAFYELNVVVESKKKMSLLQLDMQLQYLYILGIISNCYRVYKVAKLTHLKSEFLDIINLLCSTLCKNVHKVSQQQQRDIGNEIKRLNSIIQFSKILNSMDMALKDFPEVVEAVGATRETVLTWKKYDEEEALSVLRKLQDSVKVTGIATRQERELVVKAIGLKAGHWYKCVNGHFYCIGECGGAMQRGRCIECKAEIGGQSHRLAAGNEHAPEMDGSRFAAWSEQYNNLANFNLDD